MQKHSTEFYHTAIKSLYPDATNIRTPDVPGGISPLFLADTANGTQVCKFNDADIVRRNHIISGALNSYGVPVPRTQTHAYQDAHLETYEYCPEKTLFEHINNDMSDDKIFGIYTQILNALHQMTQVDIDSLNLGDKKHFSDIYIANTRNNLPLKLVLPYSVFVNLMSRPGKQYLIHNDINTKNVLATSDGKLARILDLDPISVGNEVFAILILLRYCPLDAHKTLMEYYQDISGHKLPQMTITQTLRFLGKIRGTRRAFDNWVVRHR